MAMGMGRPLAPGSYIVGVQNDTQVAAADATYTIESRGIGSSYLIPVTDLDFFSGAASHPGGGVMGACGRNAATEMLRDM